MPRRAILVVVGLALVAGAAGLCVLAATSPLRDRPPTRVARPLAPADVLGTWHDTSGHPEQVITVTLAADGTFRQSVAAAASTTAGPQTQEGQWELRDGYVYLHGVLMKQMEGNWAPERRLDFWEVVESRERPGQTAIYGGIYPDPDVWHEFTKVR